LLEFVAVVEQPTEPSIVWTRQYGTSDSAYAVATDASGMLYLTGNSSGALDGPNVGEVDVFVRSFDGDGSLRWGHQFGTTGTDIGRDVATDTSGSVYVTGTTGNSFRPNAFVRSYDGDGDYRWTREFNAESDGYGDRGVFAYGIATDTTGNVYTTGHTRGDLAGATAGGDDAFIRSFDSGGSIRWTRLFGTTDLDVASAIATDTDGNVFAAGYTLGDLAGTNAGSVDAFIRSYDSDGSHRWTRQFGTSGDEVALGIATDASGNVYTTGRTNGDLEGSNAGIWDVFIRSYDSEGNLRWTRQFGTSGRDESTGIATDADGFVFVSGYTQGDLAGTLAGSGDAFIRSYDSNGSHRWTRQFGTSGDDYADAIATDETGSVFAIAKFGGSFSGLNAGSYIMKFGR
ncbi:MAG: SBBP repeat-containing protein, partial [Thioalkalivibrio sp.]|nr:SBBP repeat-containing protein [Thioalkalivibrio sp.]